MKTTTAMLCMILAAPLLALGEGATPSAPVDAPGPRFHRAGGEGAAATTRPVSDQEWGQFMAFLKENSPNRWQELEKGVVPERSPLRERVLRQWRNYKLLKEQRFSNLADLALDRIRTEDKIFALWVRLRDNPESLNEISVKAHELAAQLVDLSIKERQGRIAQLKELLDKENAAFEYDQSHREELINARAAQIMSHLRPTTAPSSGPPSQAYPPPEAPPEP